jgi:hypothetical protein
LLACQNQALQLAGLLDYLIKQAKQAVKLACLLASLGPVWLYGDPLILADIAPSELSKNG